MYKRIVFGLAIILLFQQCAYSQQAEVSEGEKSKEKEYVISAGDVLQIAVYEEPDLSVIVRASEDGTVNYPLLGNIKAAGLTVRELEKSINELLARDYLVNPQVSIFVKEFMRTSKPVYISILGQVRSPGSYEMRENLTLTQAIALAGDFTEIANISKVKIIRGSAGVNETMEIDVNQILNKSAPDIQLKSNDTIMVSEYGRISIMGQVSRPGVYNLKKGLTVIEAIGLAGGFTPTAAQDGTRIVRIENGAETTIAVKISAITKGTARDILLQEGDTVVVPESFF